MSPLEFRQSEWGLIPIEGSTPLCSQSAALQEASDWVSKHHFSENHVVILGLGAGFHLEQWLLQHPGARATVIETREGLSSPFLKTHPELRSRFEVLVLESLEALSRHEIIDEIAAEQPPVLCFRPSWGDRQTLFEKFFAFLTARSPEGLQCFLEKFGEKGLQIEALPQHRLLSVRDLGLLVETGFQNEKRSQVVRVLKELLV